MIDVKSIKEEFLASKLELFSDRNLLSKPLEFCINYSLLVEEFIRRVIEGRNESIQITPLIFSGLTWTGSDAFNIGLIDGFGDVNFVSREKIKSKYTIDYTFTKGFFSNIKEKVNLVFYKKYDI